MTSTLDELRNQVAQICKLHGVEEASYWNIADEIVSQVLAKLISKREIEARIDEQNRTNFYDTGVAITSEDEWGNPITVNQAERLNQLTKLQEGKE